MFIIMTTLILKRTLKKGLCLSYIKHSIPSITPIFVNKQAAKITTHPTTVIIRTLTSKDNCLMSSMKRRSFDC